MYKLIASSFIIFYLFSCSESDNSTNSATNDNQKDENPTDTLSPTDTLAPKSSFIEDFKLYREELLSKGDYSIEIKTLIEDNGFEFYFISEKLDDKIYNYCISLNGSTQHIPYAEEIDYFLDIQTHLGSRYSDFQLFIGSPSFIGDVNNDTHIDYFITNEWNFRTSSGGNGQVLTYDGDKGLNLSSYSSASDFESGICEHIIGFKEELTFSKDDPFEIIIKRNEVKSDPNTCEIIYELNYEKKFKWKLDKWTGEPAINSPISSATLNKIPKIFSYLHKTNDGFVIEEDCQNGGNWEIGIKEYELTDGAKYFILDEFDNVESYFLAGIQFIDENNFDLIWRPLGEYASGGDFESVENSGIVRTMKVRKDADSDDIYYINHEPYTVSPDQYKYIPCEDH